MRTSAIVIVFALLAPVLARAEGVAVDAKALGTTEALLNYCSKADPGSVERIRQQVTRIRKGASDQAIAQTRNSAEYRKAGASVKDFVEKIDPHNVKKVCSESVATAR